MDPGALDVLHHPRNETIVAVADDVDFYLFAEHVCVHEDRRVRRDIDGMLHIGDQLVAMVDDLHRPAAQHVRGPHEHRIADLIRDAGRGLHRSHRPTRRLRNAQAAEQLLELVPILRHVDLIGGGAEDRHARVVERPRQVDRRLPAELDDDPLRALSLDHRQHVFQRQRLEVQLVRRVKVGGNRLRIVIDDDRLVPRLPQRPDAVDGAVVKLDSLPDPNRPAADHDRLRAFRRSGVQAFRSGGRLFLNV